MCIGIPIKIAIYKLKGSVCKQFKVNTDHMISGMSILVFQVIDAFFLKQA